MFKKFLLQFSLWSAKIGLLKLFSGLVFGASGLTFVVHKWAFTLSLLGLMLSIPIIMLILSACVFAWDARNERQIDPDKALELHMATANLEAAYRGSTQTKGDLQLIAAEAAWASQYDLWCHHSWLGPIAVTLEIARDVAKKLIEMDTSSGGSLLTDPGDRFDFPLIVAA